MAVSIPLALIGGAYFMFRRNEAFLRFSIVARLLTAACVLSMAMRSGAATSGMARFGVLDALALLECLPALLTLGALWRVESFTV